MKKRWWFLVGAFLAPNIFHFVLLNSYHLLQMYDRLNVDLRVWIWISIAVSLAIGVLFIFLLPMRWYFRVYFAVAYLVLMLNYTILTAEVAAGSLWGG